MPQIKIKIRFLTAAFLLAAFLPSGSSYSAEPSSPQAEAAAQPYPRPAAIKTIINPHEQINDEGEILWDTCVVCHRNVPDLKKEKSIKDTLLRFEDDLKEMCYRCHLVKAHPGSEGVSVMVSGFTAPNHLRVPPDNIKANIRLTLKEVSVILPFEPKTGKIFCATCHNPHERGLLTGRADLGADYQQRLRSQGLDVCQYCHRK